MTTFQLDDRVTPAASMPLGTEDSNTFGTVTAVDHGSGFAGEVWVRWDRSPGCEFAHPFAQVKDASLADVVDPLPLAGSLR